MSNIFKKAAALGRAYTDYRENGLPEGEEYYKERMEICSTCEWNSKFQEEKPKGFIEKGMDLLRSKLPSEYHCTACGCDLGLKCAGKDNTCGLVEKGLEPKWTPIETPVGSIPGMFIIKTQGQDYNLRTEVSNPIITIKDADPKLLEFTFGLIKPERYKYTNSRVSCGCTVPAFQTSEDNKSGEVKVRISTLNFKPGQQTRKSITMEFERNDGKLFEFRIYFDITVIGG